MEKVPGAASIAPAGAILGAGIASIDLASAWGAGDVPVTAVGILLAGLSLLLVRPPRGPLARRIGRALATATAMVGVLILVRYGFDWMGVRPGLRLLAGDEHDGVVGIEAHRGAPPSTGKRGVPSARRSTASHRRNRCRLRSGSG